MLITIIYVFLMTLTHQNEGYVIKVNKSKVLKYGVDSILQKYLNPIRKLSEDFPNHQVEVQLDILGGVLQTTVKEPQRIVRAFYQPIIRRGGIYPKKPPPVPETVSTTASTTTTQSPTTPSTTTTSTTSTTTTTTPSTTTDFGKQPVYMDDLKKVVDHFEMRFSTTPTSTTNWNGHQTQETHQTLPRPFHPTTYPGPVYPVDRSIFGLIKLLRKGVQLDSPVTRPTKEGLEWLQVKIPRPTWQFSRTNYAQ